MCAWCGDDDTAVQLGDLQSFTLTMMTAMDDDRQLAHARVVMMMNGGQMTIKSDKLSTFVLILHQSHDASREIGGGGDDETEVHACGSVA